MPTSVAGTPTLAQIRSRFPSLASGFAYLENAGGSQVPAFVAHGIRDYMLTSYVQLGAGYPQSDVATDTVARAHAFVNRIMGGEATGHVILGPSTTQLLTMLVGCYSRELKPGDRILVAETGHEANIGPWFALERFGVKVEVWPVDPESLTCRIDTLQALLEGGQVKIVALPHVSNLLGGIVDVAAITRAVHDAGARVVVDGVAYAPHRPIDVAAWNVDWYVYSTYKVYGPHMGALYGRADAVEELTGPNHFFVPRNLIPYKFQLGGACHEGCAGLLSLGPYLNFLAGAGENGQTTREMVVRAFLAMADLELPLQKLLIDYLRERRGLKVIGPQHGERSRVTTISFLASKRRSSELATALNRHGLGVRSGSAYAYRLCQKLGIDPEEGVVRASMVHYNMLDEVRRLIEALETELPN